MCSVSDDVLPVDPGEAAEERRNGGRLNHQVLPVRSLASVQAARVVFLGLVDSRNVPCRSKVNVIKQTRLRTTGDFTDNVAGQRAEKVVGVDNRPRGFQVDEPVVQFLHMCSNAGLDASDALSGEKGLEVLCGGHVRGFCPSFQP